MEQYKTFELTFSGRSPAGDCVHADIQAEFSCGGEAKTVPGFYCGGGVYKVRFLPERAGAWSWRVTGAVSAQGREDCAPAAEGNHGMVKADGTAFRFQDGKLFHPFGTTVYALISQTDELIAQTMDTLSKAPFNKIRMCVFPKHYDFNHNEPPYYPFEKAADGSWDTAKPCYPFWDALDRHIVRLGQMGIQVDLILFHSYDRWGFDGMGLEKDKTYLDYLIRRLAAYPNIWWSLANEYELTRRTMEDWYEIEAFVAGNDPYGHLLSCHNIFCLWDANRPRITHSSIQSKDLGMLGTWQERYAGKPLMLDECAYEGNIEHTWGSITGAEMTRRFWKAVTIGAYCTHGETFYDDNDVLWWAKGGVLKGESPARIAFCRKIIESLPGHLEGEPSFIGRMVPLLSMDEAARERTLQALREGEPAELADTFTRLARAFIASGKDADSFAHSEQTYYGHIGTDCYLRFHDTRPISRDTVVLPTDKTYTVQVIDVWNMTIDTVATGVSGKYTVAMPEKENMAVLILAEGNAREL